MKKNDFIKFTSNEEINLILFHSLSIFNSIDKSVFYTKQKKIPNCIVQEFVAMTWFAGVIAKIYAAHIRESIPFGFQPSVFVLRVTGIWPTTNDSRWYKWLTIAFFLFVGCLFPLSMFINFVFANSLEESMNQLLVPMAAWNTTFKAGIIYWQRNRIRELFCIHASCARTEDTDHTRFGRLNFRVHIVITSLYMFWCLMTIVQIVIADADSRIFPSTLLWPHDFAQRRTVYLGVLMFQVVSSVPCVLWTAIEDSLSIAMIVTVCGHLTELKERLRSLGMRCDAGEDRDERFYRDLVGCCERYEDCLKWDIYGM